MRLVAAAALSALAACTTPPAASARRSEVTQVEWDEARARLNRLRAALPHRPYAQPVTVDFFEPRSRRHFDGRGAVGVDPGHAMRMILVGPAGEPALDVWVTKGAWRLVVPAIRLVRRGGAETPSGSPVGFFRSWFVDPLGGTLLALGPAAGSAEGGTTQTGARELIVRNPFGGTLHVLDADAGETLRSIRVRRRSGAHTESFSYAGGHASYRDETSGLTVEVTLGPVQRDPPDPEAFRDPGSEAAQ